MNSDDPSMLSDDQIDYGRLPDSTLESLVLGDDLFIANSALSMLSQRQPSRAASVAADILEKKLGDRYLQAAAINVLFDTDPQAAVATICRHFKDWDPYVFHSILELMIHNQAFFQDRVGLMIVEWAFGRLKASASGDKWPTQEVMREFARLYRAR